MYVEQYTFASLLAAVYTFYTMHNMPPQLSWPEQLTCNEHVGGSNPSGGSSENEANVFESKKRGKVHFTSFFVEKTKQRQLFLHFLEFAPHPQDHQRSVDNPAIIFTSFFMHKTKERKLFLHFLILHPPLLGSPAKPGNPNLYFTFFMEKTKQCWLFLHFLEFAPPPHLQDHQLKVGKVTRPG